jgi:hypothetical protein
MPHSRARGQVEPLAALAAVLAVTAALTLYAGTLANAVSTTSDRAIAETTLQRVTATLESAGVIDPSRLRVGHTTVPDGWDANLTLRANGTEWTRGPTPPSNADRATSHVSVRLSPMTIQRGELRVVVWQ